MSVENPFGQMDLLRLLEDSDGLISFKLYDSGTFRTGATKYSFESQESDRLRIWPMGNPGKELTLSRFVPLRPHTVVFVGLYIGDGAKASRPGSSGIISFSQREPHLTSFVREHFIQLFGDTLTFTHRVNEDSLFFMTDEMRQKLTVLRQELLKSGRKDILSDEELRKYLNRDLESVIQEQPSATKIALEKHSKKALLQKHRKYLVEFFANRTVMNEYLRKLKLQELAASGNPLSPKDRIAVNVRLPGVKGAREEGKSSRSDELDVDGLANFHALLLRIISDIQSSIESNSQLISVPGSDTPWLTWNGKPHEYGVFSLSTLDYLRFGDKCFRFSRGSPRRYKCSEKETIVLEMGKLALKVPKTLTFTPLLSLFFGLYLAEGQTPKSKIFKFAEEPVGSLSIGFTASEADSMSICLKAMKQLLIGNEAIPDYWRVKVGSKYFAETVTIGNKLGTVALRRGEKGQGTASGFEIVQSIKEWTTASLPSLQKIDSKFDHLEYTGAGIPRVDVFYSKGPEVYVFSLMRDLVSYPRNLDRFSTRRGGPK